MYIYWVMLLIFVYWFMFVRRECFRLWLCISSSLLSYYYYYYYYYYWLLLLFCWLPWLCISFILLSYYCYSYSYYQSVSMCTLTSIGFGIPFCFQASALSIVLEKIGGIRLVSHSPAFQTARRSNCSPWCLAPVPDLQSTRSVMEFDLFLA